MRRTPWIACLIGSLLPVVGRASDAPPADETVIRGWFRELPFSRTVDVELQLGFPELAGVCFEGNPSGTLSIEGCAATIIFVSSLILDVKSRFLRYLDITADQRPGRSWNVHGWEVSFGPLAGARLTAILNLFGAASGGAREPGPWGIDGGLSFEAVYWCSRFIGVGVQLDGGFVWYPPQSDPENVVWPTARLSFGLSF